MLPSGPTGLMEEDGVVVSASSFTARICEDGGCRTLQLGELDEWRIHTGDYQPPWRLSSEQVAELIEGLRARVVPGGSVFREYIITSVESYIEIADSDVPLPTSECGAIDLDTGEPFTFQQRGFKGAVKHELPHPCVVESIRASLITVLDGIEWVLSENDMFILDAGEG